MEAPGVRCLRCQVGVAVPAPLKQLDQNVPSDGLLTSTPHTWHIWPSKIIPVKIASRDMAGHICTADTDAGGTRKGQHAASVEFTEQYSVENCVQSWIRRGRASKPTIPQGLSKEQRAEGCF